MSGTKQAALAALLALATVISGNAARTPRIATPTTAAARR